MGDQGVDVPSSLTVPEIFSPMVGLWAPAVVSTVCLRVSWCA